MRCIAIFKPDGSIIPETIITYIDKDGEAKNFTFCLQKYLSSVVEAAGFKKEKLREPIFGTEVMSWWLSLEKEGHSIRSFDIYYDGQKTYETVSMTKSVISEIAKDIKNNNISKHIDNIEEEDLLKKIDELIKLFNKEENDGDEVSEK